MELMAFMIMFLSWIFIAGTAGSLENDYITIEQAVIRFAIGVIVLAVDTQFINYLWERRERVEQHISRSGQASSTKADNEIA